MLRAKSITLLKENMGVYLHDLRFGNIFLDMTSKEQAIKENKLGFIKTKSICALKDTIKKVKRQSQNGRKYW